VFETSHEKKDGTIFPIEVSSKRIGLGEGKFQIVSIERDITERKQLEEELRYNDARHSAMIANIGDVIGIMAVDGIIKYKSPNIERYFGWKPEDLVGTDGWQTVHPEDVDQLKTEFHELIKKNTKPTVEYRYKCKDGTYKWIELTAVNRVDDPAIDGVLLNYHDITERKRAEADLRESEARFRRLMGNAQDMIYRMSLPDGTYEYVSPASTVIFGYSPAEFIQAPQKIRETIHPDSLDYFREQWENLIKGEMPAFYEYQIVHGRTGETRRLHQRNMLIRDDAGHPIAIEGIVTDITDLKRNEEIRLTLERQVQHAQKLESLGVLAGGIAHDFNNLLMGILGNADLALMKLAPMSPVRENMEEIEKASSRAADLCKQMLAYSGKGRFVIEAVNLSELVDEMTHMLEVSISKKAILKYDFADNVPPIEADATQMRQIVMNLITNASEAIGEKSGVISVRTGAMECDKEYLSSTYLDEKLPEGVYSYFEVSDTGCGMDKETQSKLFDPFFTTKFTGRGLGMSAVLGIVRGHKGIIKVYSELGKGTSFKALFPAQMDSVVETARETKDGDAADWNGSGTVLLVDDEETVLSVGKSVLEYCGFEVLTAEDGRIGVDLFREHADEIVCVVLDLTMPHLDGEQTFQELRRIQHDVKVIMSSGYNEQEVTQRFVGKGLAGFIQKPYRSNLLRDKLREVLG